MGELHLEIIKLRLTRDYKVDVQVGKPKVSYREADHRQGEGHPRAVTRSSRAARAVRRLLHSVEPFDGTARADVKPLEPEVRKKLHWEGRRAFENNNRRRHDPQRVHPSWSTASAEPARRACSAGFSLDQPQGRTLTDGSYARSRFEPDRVSSWPGLRFIDAEKLPGLRWLEPIMKVVVPTPKDFVGNVTGDLNRRRGLILDSQERGNTVVIEAEVPLSEMFGYTTELRSMSTGRAAAAMEPLKYAIVPANVKKAILEEVGT
jgi:elongation factor G